MSEYITPAEYATYSLPSTTTQATVIAASAVVDGFLQRPAGSVFTRVSGVPGVMACTGQPIIEIRHNSRIDFVQLSYTPTAFVALVEQRQNGAWATISAPYAWESNGLLWLDSLKSRMIGDGQVRVTYLGGWDADSLPAPIKQAVANIIIGNAQSQLPGNIKKWSAGDTSIERFDDTSMDADTRAMLTPFKRIFA